MPKESQLQSNCIKYLKEKDIYHVNVHGSGWTGKGTPDLLICHKGKFVAVELKVGNNDLQADQIVRRNRILKSGGQYCCPKSLEEFIKFMEEL
jgi:Holliday junction resolvase